MFNLTTQELDAAFAAISHHGYSTMLPEPAEWRVVKDNWTVIRESIVKLDLDNYEPFAAMRVFAPKSRANIRVTHLLHPQDLIIYTALVLIVSQDIESNRISTKSKRVFSYRISPTSDPGLYHSRGSFEAYLGKLSDKADKGSVKFVALADIADFYPRIYQHRLENVIESIAKNPRTTEVARVLVRKLIANLMGRNSYGIPVGPYASRLLGEAILIDVDANLQSQGIDFVRWVDDYNIFCKNEYEAQSVIFSLAEWLFSNHGLTLQSAKSKILPVARFKSEILIQPEGQLTDRDTVVQVLREFRIGYEGDVDDEEPNEVEIASTLAALQAIDLRGMLQASLADTALVDYEAVTFALVKLPRIPGVSVDLKHDILDLVIENAELLYPVAEYIAKYVLSFTDLTPREQRNIAAKLLKPLKSKHNPPPPYYAMWILHIFSTSTSWNHVADIIDLYRNSRSEIVKRQAALAIHVSGNRAEALVIKDDYVAASPMLKSAILFASTKLGIDERKHWKLSKSVTGVIEKLI
jgi:hypothetical protein